MIRWLHISDLHFKPGLDSDSDQSTMQRALLNDCRIHKIQADFVVATGDFHNFGDKKDYKTAVSFLQRLIEELQLDLEKDFFWVPGNHDVNDDLIHRIATKRLHNSCRKRLRRKRGILNLSLILLRRCQSLELLFPILLRPSEIIALWRKSFWETPILGKI